MDGAKTCQCFVPSVEHGGVEDVVTYFRMSWVGIGVCRRARDSNGGGRWAAGAIQGVGARVLVWVITPNGLQRGQDRLIIADWSLNGMRGVIALRADVEGEVDEVAGEQLRTEVETVQTPRVRRICAEQIDRNGQRRVKNQKRRSKNQESTIDNRKPTINIGPLTSTEFHVASPSRE
ncbi:hypothetical protein BDN70DRAFT_899622 [Pholiota conissans]|uniref:Uncharacterized protein n=1 Tax=Pholiota conissans TaxID=109636 RepID=A0A9P6CU53_9AGAR|nr:hypothetical protein BDN70DRAFT_899622 [Pholiota conissans]